MASAVSRPRRCYPRRGLIFSDVADQYLKRHIWVPSRRTAAAQYIQNYVRILERLEIPVGEDATASLGTRPFVAITKADMEAARETRRRTFARTTAEDWTRPGCKGGEVGIEHLVAVARQIWNWAIREGAHRNNTLQERGGVSVIRVKTGASSPRTRRLERRRGAQVDRSSEFPLAGAHHRGARDGLPRRGAAFLAMAPSPLGRQCAAAAGHEDEDGRGSRCADDRTTLAVLEMRRHTPDGVEHAADGYVFSKEVGERVGRVATAWRAACRRAEIADLHFHDLRREFASRLLESGASDHEVRDWLGHANITTTSRYLATTRVRLQRTLVAFEARQTRGSLSSSTASQLPCDVTDPESERRARANAG